MWAVRIIVALALLAPVAGASTRERASFVLALADARVCGAAPGASASVLLSIGRSGRPGCAALGFVLARPGEVEFLVVQRKPQPRVVHRQLMRAQAGPLTVVWRPREGAAARTYVTRLTLRERAGAVTQLAGPVIRIRGTAARFEAESYRPGSVATLVVDDPSPSSTISIVDAATDAVVVAPKPVRGGRARVAVGRWPAGVYLARLSTEGGVTHAPLVVGAAARSRPRVAVVLPTSTWQAYNLRDRDGDGWGDSWYASRARESARLDRPFLDSGLPPFFHRYDLPFLHWFRARGRRADFLGDADLDRIRDSATLARRYDLLVFPGHHEYVTEHEFDLLEGYRDRGGNLAFLSADNLHWRVERQGPVLRRKEQFRRKQRPRPEAALVGVQYRASDDGSRRGAYVVRSTGCAPWLFRGTKLAVGSRFGWSGVEIDATTIASPDGTCVIAEIPNVLRRGRTAQMSYYETARGAKVFAAGAFLFANRMWVTRRLLDNLWETLSRP
jgi:hypothetical protein